MVQQADRLDSIFQVSDKFLGELKAWLEPWFRFDERRGSDATTPGPTFADTMLLIGATKSLLGWWRLGDGPTTWADSNPYQSACDASTVLDVTPLTAHVSGALAGSQDDGAVQFNGGGPPSASHGDYLQTGCASRFNLNTTDFSVAFWMNAPDLGAGAFIGGVVAVEGAGISSGFGWWLVFDHGYLATDRLSFVRQQDGGLTLQTDATLTLDAWHFVVGTYSTVDGMKLYVDGALVDSDATTFNTGTPNTGVTIGRLGAAAQFFTGKVDEVSVWGDVLSDSEIMSLYLSGVTVPGATHSIRLEDGGSFVVFDHDGNPIFRVQDDGTVHIVTGTTVIDDL